MAAKPRSWNEIRKEESLRAGVEGRVERVRREADVWSEFFAIFGIVRFEKTVKKLDGAKGFIDAFWRQEEHAGRCQVEPHRSAREPG